MAAFLPVAAADGEPLIISNPVDRSLLDNAKRLLALWTTWYPQLKDVSVECAVDDRRLPRRDRCAAFFAGGVDSFFTLLSREGESPIDRAGHIDDLLTVCGFDVPLSKPEDCARLQSTHRGIAECFGKRDVDIWTNLRETQFHNAPWAGLAHGAALAAVALVFERRYDSIFIPSTHRVDHVMPWGSHPLTDPLFSTSDVHIAHDGIAYGRVEKTEHIIKWDVALENLRVCAYSRSAENCSACGKCFRTMATLDLLGALPKARTFQTANYSVEKLATVYSSDASDEAFLREIQTHALRRGRDDIARAIERARGQSARLQKWVAVAEWMGGLPVLWRLGEALEQWALAGHVH